MRKLLTTIGWALLCLHGISQNYKVWYNEPAQLFEEAFPIGNGRMGAMIYGRTEVEKISLNEITLWAGKPQSPDINPEAASYLPKVREALFNENYQAADSLMHFMQGRFSESYAPLGNLTMTLNHRNVSGYRRELDLATGISRITYQWNESQITRETFVSHPDQVMVIRITSKGKDRSTLTLGFQSLLPFLSSAAGKDWVVNGRAPSHAEPSYRGNMPNAVQFDSAGVTRFGLFVRVLQTDGKQQTNKEGITISEFQQVTILVSVSTNFISPLESPAGSAVNGKGKCMDHVTKASTKGYELIRKKHIEDFSGLFNRVHFELGNSNKDELPTNERLKRYTEGGQDNNLVTLYYQFGRYLLISSSRTPGIPVNLQGLWNEEIRPPWSSNYTTNINTEMNYWLAENTNLSELHLPLLQFTRQLAKNGAVTARNYYGAGGWALHHNTDNWAMTNPVGDFGKGDPVWANWNMGSAWISAHLWEHFAFNRDTFFLKQYYPILKGAVQFSLDMLVKDKAGKLVTAPSFSPENVYITSTGYKGATFYGGTADLSMIRELFSDYLEAESILRNDRQLAERVKNTLQQLHPYTIGQRGNLQEWYHDWSDAEPQHRHVSHLYGVYPGHSITVTKTPELAQAVKKSLEFRTNNGTGWSIAWKINLWARLKDAEMAYDAVKKILTYYPARAGETKYSGGGTYPNLFDAHPPFQIDGNFGASAGITEMLLQSHEGTIDLLPALPAAWPDGSIEGIRARGGYTVHIRWKLGKLQEAIIIPDFNGKCKVSYRGKTWEFDGKKGNRIRIQPS